VFWLDGHSLCLTQAVNETRQPRMTRIFSLLFLTANGR
jgi:hypothetical protein